MQLFSVVLPACNEEEAIAGVIRGIKQMPFAAEIIVVDDGSSDRTAEIARTEGVRVLSHALTVGAGKSVKDGIDHASHEFVVMLDADGSYPPDRIFDMLQQLERGFDLVVGARQGSEYRGSPVKIAARFIFRMIVEFVTGKRIPDINSGMRAFRRGAVREYYPHLCEGFGLPTTMTLAYLFTGRTVCYVPIPYYKRLGKSKVHFLRDSLRTLQYITESIAYFNPVKLFMLLAILTFLIGLTGGSFVQPILFWQGCLVSVLVFALGLMVYGSRARKPYR